VTASVILTTPNARERAKRLIDRAPDGYVATVRERTRTSAQNDMLWAMLTDVARSRPEGREHTADTWKAIFMHALNHEQVFEMGLDGRPFPMGFRSSRLSVSQMAALIDFVSAWGTQNGVQWTGD
jgi:hypothetical protein